MPMRENDLERRPLRLSQALRQEYGRWFGSLVVGAVAQKASDDVQQSVLFVTLTFKQSGRRTQTAEGQSLGANEMAEFSRLYNLVCRMLVGRHFDRPRNKPNLPPAFAFLDAKGSKYWKGLRELENLHIHSMWVVPSDKSEACQNLIHSATSNSGGAVRVDSVHIEVVDASSIEDLVATTAYSSKLIQMNTERLEIGEDFRVFPL